jgi:hypothetical protein
LNVGPAPAGQDSEQGGPTPEGETDPLVSNGLGSPLCRPGLAAGGLSAVELRHCETSGFIAAPAPTGNYGIDVHIDTGLLGISSGGFLSGVQDLFVTPLWMALVWAVHAVVVMLEWCFTVDLIGAAASRGVARVLRQAESALTVPWLGVVLSIASVLALYEGIVRRRVSETVGRSLLMGTMMVGGLWVIADPAGTVGALGRWAGQASLGTLSVAASGSPTGAAAALARSMDSVFTAAIEAPWCYMEFGDVDWCRDPARLDAGLRAAGLRIAAGELRAAGCKQGPGLACGPIGGSQSKALTHSAQLLREADSNGAIFLALPANGPQRNSINEPGSLLRALCQSTEATRCQGPNAARAEFRTNGGTWSRVGGLLLIGAGVVGMLLLLGFFALRLLAAALFSLLYLLLAPGMVLAPALGESGRAVFRKWATQLLGAVVSKLLFSFLLGVVLAVVAILSGLEALGWWTQWLLMSAFWWGAFARRHEALGLAQRTAGREQAARPRPFAVRIADGIDTPRKALVMARAAYRRLGGPAPNVRRSGRVGQLGSARSKPGVDEQVRRLLECERRDARARRAAAPAIREALATRRSQLERVRRERAKALASGDTRRGGELLHRATRIEKQIERDQRELDVARQTSADGERLRRDDTPRTPGLWRARQAFLDRQAALPPSAAARRRSHSEHAGRRRDYAALAGLAGYGAAEYELLPPGRRRAARLLIDRELALRRELNVAATRVVGETTAQGLADDRKRRSNGQRDSAVAGRPGKWGHPRPGAQARDGGRRRPGGGESSVMRDAREVAAQRKRQLGRDRA